MQPFWSALEQVKAVRHIFIQCFETEPIFYVQNQSGFSNTHTNLIFFMIEAQNLTLQSQALLTFQKLPANSVLSNRNTSASFLRMPRYHYCRTNGAFVMTE
jgi:hypothetical protein